MEKEVESISTQISEKNWPVSKVSMEKEVESMFTKISKKSFASVHSVHGKRGRLVNVHGII